MFRRALLRGGAALVLLPAAVAAAQTASLAPEAPAQSMTTRITIKPDGSASGTVSVTASGAYAEELRTRMRGASPASMDQAATSILTSLGYEGSARFEGAAAAAADGEVRYTVRFELRQFAALPGTGSFPVRPVMFSAAPVLRFAATGEDSAQASREFACSPGSSVEAYVFILPDNMSLTGGPSEMSLRTANLRYESGLRLEGQQLSITRRVEDRHPGPQCAAADMQEYRQLTRTVLDDHKASVRYR